MQNDSHPCHTPYWKTIFPSAFSVSGYQYTEEYRSCINQSREEPAVRGPSGTADVSDVEIRGRFPPYRFYQLTRWKWSSPDIAWAPSGIDSWFFLFDQNYFPWGKNIRLGKSWYMLARGLLFSPIPYPRTGLILGESPDPSRTYACLEFRHCITGPWIRSIIHLADA